LCSRFGFDPTSGAVPLFAAARDSCAPRLSVGNFASCSFKRARTVDAAFAAAAVRVALLTLFVATAFRRTVVAGLLAAAAVLVELVRFRFETFVTAFFILARLVLTVLRATRLFDAGLLLLTRVRALDEEATFGFDLGFARDAATVFFFFELVVFFDLLRATIVNLSTRKLFRTRSRSVHENCSRSVHENCSSERQVDFSSWKPLASSPRTDAQRLPLDD
jgi:hypothetical protein